MNKTPPDNRKNLLDELDNLRGLLGDEGQDVNLDDLPLLGSDINEDGIDSDGQLPLLQPETKTAPTKATPASAPTTPNAAQPRLQQALNERVNPFLKNANDAIAAKQAARPAPSAGPLGAKPAPLMTEGQISRLVDNVVEECLPHIEQTLRVHLTAALHRQNRNN